MGSLKFDIKAQIYRGKEEEKYEEELRGERFLGLDEAEVECSTDVEWDPPYLSIKLVSLNQKDTIKMKMKE